MKINNLFVLSVPLTLFLLSACATPPSVTYDTSGMTSIKTIAVAIPQPTAYYAISAGGPIVIPIPGASLIAAAVSGAVAGTVSRATTRGNDGFNDLVKEKLGDTGLNRKFVDALEAELRAQGYTVQEIQLGQDGAPKLELDKQRQPVLVGDPYSAADAILVAPVQTGYFAIGPAQPYHRIAKTEIRIFKADTLKALFTDNLSHKTESAFQQGGIPYSYNWYSALKDDLPHAVQGVDEALMALVPQFKVDLSASRGGVSSTSAAGAKSPN